MSSEARWDVQQPLAEGGQAETFLVTDNLDIRSGQAVLKRLKNPHNERWFARFRTEVTVLRRLRHPAIVRLLDANLDTGSPYLVTEYCAGGVLNELRVNAFPVAVRLAWCTRIVDAVAYMHAHRVLHRDLKPQNVFFRRFGEEAVLGDFGLSYDLLADNPPVLDAAGPLGFRAPESVKGADARVLTPASDVYALGKLLLWILDDAGVARAVLERATAPDPAKRFRDAAELKRAFASIQIPGPPAPPETPA